MDGDILRGIKIAFGFLLVLSVVGLVFAGGYHLADEVLSGTFPGDYNFTGQVDLSAASVLGLDNSMSQTTCEWRYITTCSHSCGTGNTYTEYCPNGYYMAGYQLRTYNEYTAYNFRIYCCKFN